MEDLYRANEMQRRHQNINIPTEIIRTLVVIAETGSFTKAGERLGLSQPAISAQVKRLQTIVSGDVFEKAAGGVALTPRGRLVLTHARRFLDANDQILSLGGAAQDNPTIRLGLSIYFVEEFFSLWKNENPNVQVNVRCDGSTQLTKAMVDGYLDVACLLYSAGNSSTPVCTWPEQVVWARSRDFVLSPGQPFPLVTWLGNRSDLPSVKALEMAGLSYRIVFGSSDHHARMSAVAAGIGIMAMPLRYITEPLIVAQDYYLPPLEPLEAGIHLRSGTDAAVVEPVVQLLRKLVPPTPKSPPKTAAGRR